MPGYWRTDGTYSDGSSDVVLSGSNLPQGQEVPVKPGIASDSFTTHNGVAVAANDVATNVEVATTGYKKGIALVKGNGVQNCQVIIYGVMRDGSTAIQVASSTAGLTGYVTFELDGLDKIQVNIKNTDATTANTITADVFLQQ